MRFRSFSKFKKYQHFITTHRMYSLTLAEMWDASNQFEVYTWSLGCVRQVQRAQLYLINKQSGNSSGVVLFTDIYAI